MNYFRCCGGNEKVTIDGEKVKDKMELVTQNVGTLACGKMPTNGGTPIVFNDKLYLLTSNAKLYKWDGTTWIEISALPSGFFSPPTVVYNGEIHILGGSTLSSEKHYKWDGTTWTSVSTLPFKFQVGGVVVLNNEIHLMGGSVNPTKHYKWNGSTWTQVSTLPYNFYYGSAVVLNNEIHLLGGEGGYNTHYKWNGSSWTRVSSINYYFKNGSAVVINDEIHIFGGSESTGGNNDAKNPYRHMKFTNGSWTWLDYILFSYWSGNDNNATIYNRGITNSSAVVVFNDEIHVLASNVNKEHYILNSKIYRQNS